MCTQRAGSVHKMKAGFIAFRKADECSQDPRVILLSAPVMQKKRADYTVGDIPESIKCARSFGLNFIKSSHADQDPLTEKKHLHWALELEVIYCVFPTIMGY
jgi:hypothetical protein